jgi:hypothetical protein
MTLDEARELAQEQAAEFGVVMIVVRDDLCEDDPGGFQCVAELYRDTLYPDVHQDYWEIVGRVEPVGHA